jgi:hypothetical protein
MGSSSSKEQLITAAIENQDTTELRTILKDLTPEQIRTLCKSYVPLDENQCTILHFATWQGININYIDSINFIFVYR